MFAKITNLFRLQLFEEHEESNLARNMVVLLIIVLFGTGTPVIIRLLTTRTVDPLVATFGAIFILSLIFLWMVRHGYYTLPRYALPTLFLVAMVYLTSADQGLHDIGLPGLSVAILLGSLLNGRRGVIYFSILAVLSVVAMGIGEMTGVLVNTLSSETEAGDVVLVALEFTFVGWILLLVFNNLMVKVTEAQQATAELRELSQSLERKVVDRTRDLTLAMEGGHKILQVRDLDALFKNAIDLICEQFNLYYGQIYLVDDSKQHLTIRAGLGSVGAELVRRGHFLPISSSSINGQAAVERRAVIVTNTQEHPAFRPNALLPDTRSEIAVPLMSEDRVLGVLNLQDNEPGTFSLETSPVFQVVASQLAVALQNASLFTEIAQARAEVEAATRRLVREGWDEYLDGITRGESIGVQYDLTTVLPLTDKVLIVSPDSGTVQVPVTVAEEPVGVIHVEAHDKQFWTEERQALVTAVARQVGQQVENLRLLAEADRYRAEAEQAARRLSGQAWQDYLQDKREQASGFKFAGDTVTALTEDDSPAKGVEDTVQVPLTVHNEPIGEFVIAGVNHEDAQALLTVVSNQLSRHIENIRLTEQTEAALGQTESLYQIGHELNAATNVEEILHAALGPIFPTGIDEATLMFIELNEQGEPQTLELLAGWRMDGKLSFPVGTIFPMERFPFTRLFINDPDDPQLIGDPTTDPRVDDFTRGVMAHAGIKAIAVIPLTMGGEWVGIITCSWPQSRTFSRQEEEIFNALINMAAPAVQSQRLYFKTKAQADKEHLINEITQRIQKTISVESALQTAVKELGQALHTTTKVKLINNLEKNQSDRIKAEDVAVHSINGGSHK